MSADLCRTVIAVVPKDLVKAMLRRGYRSTDRGNGFTETLYRNFPSALEATRESRRLGFVCAVAAGPA